MSFYLDEVIELFRIKSYVLEKIFIHYYKKFSIKYFRYQS